MPETPPHRPYDLFDADTTPQVPAGTSLLVVAPEPEGRDLLVRALGRGLATGDGALVITTDDPADVVADDLRECTGESVADALRIIDCQTGDPAREEAPTVVQNVDTPRNLTDIGIGFTNAIDEFDAANLDRVRLGVLSLSVVLSYVDRETAYRFCQTLARGIGREDYVGLFVLNVNAHDEQTINTLQRASDGVLEARRDDDGIRFRIEGLDSVSTEWQSL
jgi:hypothetical protein